MKIVVASKNNIKLDAAKRGFRRVFSSEDIEVEGVAVSSDVSEQPTSDSAARQGAENRVRNARDAVSDADYWVGIESGVDMIGDTYGDFTWVSIMDHDGRVGDARSACFLLPPQATEVIEQGGELDDVGKALFGEVAIGKSKGMIGQLTDGEISRSDYTVEAVVLALIPFINPELYDEQ